MKILQISDGIPPIVLGGASSVAWDTASGLAAKGNNVTMITPAETQVLPTQRDNVDIIAIPPRGLRFAHYRSVFSRSRAHEMLKYIDRVQPDIIHAHVMAWQCGYGWIEGAAKRGIPIVVTCHDVMNIAYGRIKPHEKNLWLRDAMRFRWSWNPFRNCAIKRLLNRFCKTLTVSDALKEQMEEYGFTNLTTLHNGIDLHSWKEEDQAAARARLHLAKDTAIFLLAGRLGIDKGIDMIARTLPKESILLLAGEGNLSIFDTIKNQIRFFPKQTAEEMRLLYAATDAILVPSRCLDCFPTVALEGMACARPILATSWGGAKESVVDGITGFVMDPTNEEIWKEKMEWCVVHRSELKEMGKAGRKRMEEAFSQERYLDKLIGMYEKSLKDKSPIH